MKKNVSVAALRLPAVLALFTALFALIFAGWTCNTAFAGGYGGTEDALRAQLEEMQRQMDQMRGNMQGLKQRLNEMESRPAPVAPVVAAPEVPAPSVWTKYNMKLYGKVKFDAHYDDAEFTRYNDFVGAVAAGRDHKNDSTNFNPRDTRFGFEASHAFDQDWLALGRFEIDFYGDNNDNNLIPRMRLGYIDVSNKSMGTSVRAGQDWIPVAQLNPNTVDFGILTAAGNLWWRVPQVTVRQQVGDIELLVSAMEHRRTDTSREDRMPWALGRIQYTNAILGEGGLLAIGGGYRHADYNLDNSEKTDRWLAAAEAKLVFGPVTLQGEGWMGTGIGENFLRYDLDINNLGEPADAWGAWGDITYQVTDRISVTGGYGIDNPDNKDMELLIYNDRQFTKNEQYYLNTWYSLSEPLKVGAEWVHLETERGSDVNAGNRFTMSMQYCF
jgi:hypothetical protein